MEVKGRGTLVGFEGFTGKNILKYNDCKDCFATQIMARKQKSKRTATKITDTVEARIVDLSLKHPDCGASRLVPLLEQEGIVLNASDVYAILKRNNLQNRTLRLSKLEEQRCCRNTSCTC